MLADLLSLVVMLSDLSPSLLMLSDLMPSILGREKARRLFDQAYHANFATPQTLILLRHRREPEAGCAQELFHAHVERNEIINGGGARKGEEKEEGGGERNERERRRRRKR